MLSGDEIVYAEELSPYGLPHIVEEDVSYISYLDFDAKFKPHKKVVVGSVIATIDSPVVIGMVTKIGKRGRSKVMFCWFKDGDKSRFVKLDHVAAVPTVHEFVRQISSGIWFKVKELGHMIAVGRVLISPPKTKEGVACLLCPIFIFFRIFVVEFDE